MNKHSRETHHYLKRGKMLVSLDLCILNQGRNDDWFQERHRQETIALLEGTIAERIHEFYAKKRAYRSCKGKKEINTKPELPKMLQGHTVKIGYKFIKRHVTQRCLLTNSNFATITLFPEKLHVYVCEYHPTTVLQSTAHLMHSMYKDSTPDTVGISNYFQSGSNPEMKNMGTTSAVKKRNKLKRLVSRQKKTKPAESCSMESGYDTTTKGFPVTRSDAKNCDDNRNTRLDASCRAAAGLAGSSEEVDVLSSKTVGVRETEPIFTGQEPSRCLRKAASSGEPLKEQAFRLGKLINSDVSEPNKIRKITNNEGHLNICLPNKEASLVSSLPTPTYLTGGGYREPITEQMTDPASKRPMDTFPEIGCPLIIKTKENGGYELRAKEPNVRPFAGEEEDHAEDVEMMDLDEVVDLCEARDEVFPTGDISCLKDGKPDVECVSKLSSYQLRNLVHRNKKFLKEIFVGKRPCKRHADYKQGGYARVNLTYEAWYGPYTEDQVECIMTELVKTYCTNHNRYFEYVSKVLLPEALTKICMDVLHISQDEAKGF